MNPIETEAILLSQIDYKEYDKIVTFLTLASGKLSGILRGAKKLHSKHVGMTEPFSYVRVLYKQTKGSDLVQIQKVELLDGYMNIRQNYQKILFASYFTELVYSAVIPEEESTKIFSIFKTALHSLDEAKNLHIAKLIFEIKLLQALSIFPNLDHCSCGRAVIIREKNRLPRLHQSGRYQLDPSTGMVCCPNCLLPKVRTIAPGTILSLYHLHHSELPHLSIAPQSLKELHDAFLAYFRYHFNKKIRSSSLLPKL